MIKIWFGELQIDWADDVLQFTNNGRPFDDWFKQNYSNLKTQCYFKFKENYAEKRKEQ